MRSRAAIMRSARGGKSWRASLSAGGRPGTSGESLIRPPLAPECAPSPSRPGELDVQQRRARPRPLERLRGPPAGAADLEGEGVAGRPAVCLIVGARGAPGRGSAARHRRRVFPRLRGVQWSRAGRPPGVDGDQAASVPLSSTSPALPAILRAGAVLDPARGEVLPLVGVGIELGSSTPSWCCRGPRCRSGRRRSRRGSCPRADHDASHPVGARLSGAGHRFEPLVLVVVPGQHVFQFPGRGERVPQRAHGLGRAVFVPDVNRGWCV